MFVKRTEQSRPTKQNVWVKSIQFRILINQIYFENYGGPKWPPTDTPAWDPKNQEPEIGRTEENVAPLEWYFNWSGYPIETKRKSSPAFSLIRELTVCSENACVHSGLRPWTGPARVLCATESTAQFQFWSHIPYFHLGSCRRTYLIDKYKQNAKLSALVT